MDAAPKTGGGDGECGGAGGGAGTGGAKGGGAKGEGGRDGGRRGWTAQHSSITLR